MRLSSLLVLGAGLMACESGDPPVHAPAEARDNGVQRYGAAIEGTRTVELASVLAAPDEYADETVLVEGKVRQNCTRKGCWMELAESMRDDLQGCRVTFKDYGFFVPLDSKGSTARVEGEVHTQVVPPDEVEHLESEGATFAHNAPDGSAREVRIVATGVELRRPTTRVN